MKKRERERKGQEYCKWIDQLVSIPHSTTHYMIMHRHPYAHSPHPHMHTNDLFVVFFGVHLLEFTFGSTFWSPPSGVHLSRVHLLESILWSPLEFTFWCWVHLWSHLLESTFGVHLLSPPLESIFWILQSTGGVHQPCILLLWFEGQTRQSVFRLSTRNAICAFWLVEAAWVTGSPQNPLLKITGS